MAKAFQLDFIVAGARRGGTTFLHNLLLQQPNCAIHKKADFNYFIDDAVKAGHQYHIVQESNENWERTHSLADLEQAMDFSSSAEVKGLKDADFLYWQNAHAKAKKWFPNLKLIVVLRNPVKRAYSHYVNELIKKRETLSFEEAIAQEEKRAAESDYAKLHLSYTDRGHYDQSLTRLYQTFDPANVLIILDHELYKNPQAQINRVAEFLNFEAQQVEIVESAKNANFNLELKKSAFVRIASPIIPLYTRVLNAAIIRMAKGRNERNELRAKFYAPFYKKTDFKIAPETAKKLEKAYAQSLKNLQDVAQIKAPWF